MEIMKICMAHILCILIRLIYTGDNLHEVFRFFRPSFPPRLIKKVRVKTPHMVYIHSFTIC